MLLAVGDVLVVGFLVSQDLNNRLSRLENQSGLVVRTDFQDTCAIDALFKILHLLGLFKQAGTLMRVDAQLREGWRLSRLFFMRALKAPCN